MNDFDDDLLALVEDAPAGSRPKPKPKKRKRARFALLNAPTS
jgi:hypothetical protein